LSASSPSSGATGTMDPTMLAKVSAWAEQMREQEQASPQASGAHGFTFSSTGDVTGQFDPVLSQRSAVGHATESTVQNWGGRILDSPTGVTTALPVSQTAGFGYFTQLPSDGSQPPQQQQVKFVGQDQHVYELFMTPGHKGWNFNDLTKLTSTPTAPTPLAKGTLVAFQTSFNRQQHVMYVGVDSHIHELFFDGTTWHHQDLTLITNSPPVPGNARNITGYQTTFNNQEHVDFVSADGHVRELFFDTAWHANDLSLSARQLVAATPFALPTSALAAYQTTSNSQQHVDFVASNGHLFELFINVGSAQWNPRDLTSAASAPLPDPASALAGYETTFNNQQHVDFVAGSGDEAGDLIELFFDGTNWHPNDLSVSSGFAGITPALKAGTGVIVGYQSAFNNQQHVDFISTPDNHIREFFQAAGGSWNTTDLSVASGFAAANPGLQPGTIALDAYVTTNGPNQQHVNFISMPDNVVRELFINDGGTWQNADLTDTALVPWVNIQGTWQVPQVGQPLQNALGLPGDISLTEDGWESVSWIGIDGSGSNDVLQAGTGQALEEDGDTSYWAWWEWFTPGDTSNTISNMPTSPGDTFMSSISYVGSRGFIVLVNLTTGMGFTMGLDPPSGADFEGNTAEWIMETPYAHFAFMPNAYTALPSFTPLTFTAATATNINGAVSDPSIMSGRDSNISYLDFFGNTVNLTKTSTAFDQATVTFIDWYDNDLSKIAGAPPAAGRLLGFQTTFNAQQHIVYVGTDLHVHELLFPGSSNTWQHNDLTTLTGSPPVAAGASITNYQTTFDSQQHVDFVSGDGHLREMWFDTSWHPHDLTADARNTDPSTPLVPLTSALTGYETSFNNQQHVDFISSDGHVRELWFDISIANRWNHHDLTADARRASPTMPAALVASALDGYQTAFNSQQHVNFISGNSHVNELWHDISQPMTWHWNDLTTASGGAPTALPASALDGYVTTFNNQQHVNYIGPGNQVFELFFANNAWHFNNLSALANITGVAASTRALDGYQTPFNNQQHVNFISSADNNVRELFFDGSQWRARDLTTVPLPAAPAAAGASKLTGYPSQRVVAPPPGSPSGTPSTVVDKQQHVEFVDGAGDIHELIHGP
jgi:hypothetical protein